MKLSSTSIVADNNNHRITLKITAGPKAFPLTLTNKIMKLSNPSATIVEQEIADYDTPLTFESLTSARHSRYAPKTEPSSSGPSTSSRRPKATRRRSPASWSARSQAVRSPR